MSLCLSNERTRARAQEFVYTGIWSAFFLVVSLTILTNGGVYAAAGVRAFPFPLSLPRVHPYLTLPCFSVSLSLSCAVGVVWCGSSSVSPAAPSTRTTPS